MKVVRLRFKGQFWIRYYFCDTALTYEDMRVLRIVINGKHSIGIPLENIAWYQIETIWDENEIDNLQNTKDSQRYKSVEEPSELRPAN